VRCKVSRAGGCICSDFSMNVLYKYVRACASCNATHNVRSHCLIRAHV